MFGRSHRLKSARLKEKRRKVIIDKTIIVLFCAVGLWFLIFWLSGLSAIMVRNVEVEGAVYLLPEDIAATASGFLTGRYFFTIPRASIFFYPKKNIEQNILESYPRAVSVSVGFRNFHTIRILIVEREAAALWCGTVLPEQFKPAEKSDECYLLDEDGFVFDMFYPSPNVDAKESLFSGKSSYVKFYGTLSGLNPVGQTYASAERFRALSRFSTDLVSLGLSTEAFNERPDGDYEAVLAGGTRLIFGLAFDETVILSNLGAIMADPSFGDIESFKRVDYIDLRFGNKVIYRLK